MVKYSFKRKLSIIDRRSIILGTVLLLVFLVAGIRFVDFIDNDMNLKTTQNATTDLSEDIINDNLLITQININQANSNQLQSLIGIGEVKSQAIIDYRLENGDFSTIEELMYVDGIGPVTFENIRELICVE